MNGIIKAMKSSTSFRTVLAPFAFLCLITLSLVSMPNPLNASVDAVLNQLRLTGMADLFSEDEIASLIKNLEDLESFYTEAYGLETMFREKTFLIFEPTNPSEGETVNVRLRSDVDFNRAVVSWYLNGEFQKSDYGLNFFELPVGEIGKNYSIRAEILTDTGIRKSAAGQISPAEVDIVWQANTQVPAFYEGKSLTTPADKGSIEFVALPKFAGPDTVEDPNNYVFSWKVNNVPVPGSSGRGRDTLSLDLSNFLRRASVWVEALNINTGQKVTKRISFPRSGLPGVLIYPEDKYGINYHQAINYLDNYAPSRQDIWLTALPLFFSGPETSALSIDWFMNKQPLPNFSGLNRAHFSVERGFIGDSLVSLEMNSLENSRERAVSEVMFSVR